MIIEHLVAAFESIQERRRRGLGPPRPYDVRLPLDRVQKAYAMHAWTSDDPLKNLDPNERLSILMMPPTWGERIRMIRLRDTPHAQRQAMIEIMCERRLQYDLAQSFASTLPPRTHVLPKKIVQLSPYYQERLKLHHQTHTTMLSARERESARTLSQSPEARTHAQHLDAVKARIKTLQGEVKAAQEEQRSLQKGLPRPNPEDDDEPQPTV